MILGKLKEATKEQHDALENVVDVMNRMFTRDDYKELLTKFYSFYVAIEPKLPVDELRSHGFNVDERRKLPLLERDLDTLGILESVRESNGTQASVPELDTVAKAFGSIYVMEGATLGGQVITRHLAQHLGLTPESGGSFFNSYGKMVGPMWKQFGEAITAFAEKANADDEIVETARQTFDSFRRVFAHAAEAK